MSTLSFAGELGKRARRQLFLLFCQKKKKKSRNREANDARRSAKKGGKHMKTEESTKCSAAKKRSSGRASGGLGGGVVGVYRVHSPSVLRRLTVCHRRCIGSPACPRPVESTPFSTSACPVFGGMERVEGKEGDERRAHGYASHVRGDRRRTLFCRRRRGVIFIPTKHRALAKRQKKPKKKPVKPKRDGMRVRVRLRNGADDDEETVGGWRLYVPSVCMPCWRSTCPWHPWLGGERAVARASLSARCVTVCCLCFTTGATKSHEGFCFVAPTRRRKICRESAL